MTERPFRPRGDGPQPPVRLRPTMLQRAGYRTFALVRLLVAVLVLGGLLGAGIGYGLGKLFGSSKANTPAASPSASTPALHVQPLTVEWVGAISQDGKSHWLLAPHRVVDGDPSHGIRSVTMHSPSADHNRMLGLKFHLHPGTSVTQVKVTLGHGGTQTIWLLAAQKGTTKATYDPARRVASYNGTAATATLTPAHPVSAQWYELLFPTVPAQPGHPKSYSTTVLEVAFYGTRSAGTTSG